jgi:hypothetical protein
MTIMHMSDQQGSCDVGETPYVASYAVSASMKHGALSSLSKHCLVLIPYLALCLGQDTVSIEPRACSLVSDEMR